MTSPIDPQAVDTLSEWLQTGLAADAVSSRDMDQRETFLFRAIGKAGERFELEVSYEALERATAEELIADLESQAALRLLQDNPTVRLFYSSEDGLNRNERRPITCDGRHYVVTRSRANHIVDIWDSTGSRLERMPNEPAVSPASIHRTTDDEWRARIRSWRAERQ